MGICGVTGTGEDVLDHLDMGTGSVVQSKHDWLSSFPDKMIPLRVGVTAWETRGGSSGLVGKRSRNFNLSPV